MTNEQYKQTILDALLDLERREIDSTEFFEILEEAAMRGDAEVYEMAIRALDEGLGILINDNDPLD